MATKTRNASVETRKGLHTLSLKTWKPQNTAQPASEPEDYSAIADSIQRWESWLWAERNAWSIRQRHNDRQLKVGLFGPGVRS